MIKYCFSLSILHKKSNMEAVFKWDIHQKIAKANWVPVVYPADLIMWVDFMVFSICTNHSSLRVEFGYILKVW